MTVDILLTQERAARECLQEVSLEYGSDCFGEHPSGIALRKPGVDAIGAAVVALRQYPGWTVVLEGHCPGRPDENDALRESIAEEAADLCKEHLEREGVANSIVCEGLGSLQSRGLSVRLCVAPPPSAPNPLPSTEGDTKQRAPNGDAKQDGSKGFKNAARGVMKSMADVVQAVAPPKPKAAVDNFPEDNEIDSFEVPDTSSLSPPERAGLLLRLLEEALDRPLNYEPNKAELSRDGHFTVRRLALVLKEYPELGVKCSGHSKGQPGDNNSAKRALSLQRAQATVKALQDAGVVNELFASGYGSSLGRGNCVRLHVLDTPQLLEAARVGELLLIEVADLDTDSNESILNQLLKDAMGGVAFEANRTKVSADSQPAVQRVASILKAFPRWTLMCEGHCKGTKDSNTEAKVQLSKARADAVRDAVLACGACNSISCIGHGSTESVGMCVRMLAVDLDEPFVIPDTTGMSKEETELCANGVIAGVLERRPVTFAPNSSKLPASGVSTVRSVALVLAAFPDLAFEVAAHTKGRPDEDGDAKRRLSQARAEVVRAALLAEEGVHNIVYAAGKGSSQGKGMFLEVTVVEVQPEADFSVELPDIGGMDDSEARAALNDLFERVLATNIDFEPNSSSIPWSSMRTIRSIVYVMNAFPGTAYRIEAHTKGTPDEDNEAKRKLSLMRAESLKAAVRAAGAGNKMHCIGAGSASGRGMHMRILAMAQEELRELELEIPDTAAMSRPERAVLLDGLLAKALSNQISFEPNKTAIDPHTIGTVETLSQVLKAFADLPVVCEGHTKGKPGENSEARNKLSQQRAESVRRTLAEEFGVQNAIRVLGHGSSMGLGMCVRMYTDTETADVADTTT